MFSLAKRRLQLRRSGVLISVIVACGLLAACTQAPKLAKAPGAQSEADRTVDARPAPAPAH